MKRIFLIALISFFRCKGISSNLDMKNSAELSDIDRAKLMARYECGAVNQPLYDPAFVCGVGVIQDKPANSLPCKVDPKANRKVWHCMIAQGMNYGAN